jgi:signal transduction histidine kinase
MQFVPGPAWGEIQRAFYGPVFQSITELAVNAAKHGAASRVVLSAVLDAEANVNVSVADDGRGLGSAGASTRGFGLFSVERRMACIAGALEIQSSPESGTTATLRLPTTA